MGQNSSKPKAPKCKNFPNCKKKCKYNKEKKEFYEYCPMCLPPFCKNCHTKYCYKDTTTNKYFDYCGRSCAEAAVQGQLNTVSPPVSVPVYQPQVSNVIPLSPIFNTSFQNIPLCMNCGENRPLVDGRGTVYAFCSETCYANFGQGKMCKRCLRYPVWVDSITGQVSPYCSEQCIRDDLHPSNLPIVASRPPSIALVGPCIVPLKDTEPKYVELKNQFMDKWLHTRKTKPTVKAICAIGVNTVLKQQFESHQLSIPPSVPKFTEYAGIGNTVRRFHGTKQVCDIGFNGNTSFCSDSLCAVCGIIRTGWKLSFINSNSKFHKGLGRFGHGLYFTATSSKADDYSTMAYNNLSGKKSELFHTHGYKSVLVANVVAGNVYKAPNDMPNLVTAPSGHHSVVGDSTATSSLNYDEIAVYSEDACIPTYLIIYE